ncbi:MAG: methyltransferase family protein [Candidatus Hodarchaeota archaeon]
MENGNNIKSIFFNITGYLILFIQQIPGLWIWIPFMAAPVIIIISALLSNLPTSITEAYQNFFMLNEVFIGKILIILSVIILVYSIIYLGLKKRQGLVTTGPYRFVKHPQYTGFLLLTIGLTAWSYFYIKNFFGRSWISADETIALWYLELLAYIILAFIEERYLSKKFGIEYISYKNKTSLFIPLPKSGKFDVVISTLIFSFLLYIAII